MSDIANELRERSLRAEQEGEPLALLDDAADEIERLRLTDEERTFLRMVRDTYAMQDDDEVCGMIAASISGLLERTQQVGPAPVERLGATKVTDVGGAGPT
jgi:hypothetical protein